MLPPLIHGSERAVQVAFYSPFSASCKHLKYLSSDRLPSRGGVGTLNMNDLFTVMCFMCSRYGTHDTRIRSS